MYIRKIVVTLQYFLLTPKKCSKTAFDKKKKDSPGSPLRPSQISTYQQIPPFFLSYTHTVGDLTTNCYTKGLFK